MSLFINLCGILTVFCLKPLNNMLCSLIVLNLYISSLCVILLWDVSDCPACMEPSLWHWYLSTHLYDCYWVLFMRWLLSFIYVMFIVSMWGLISSICVTAIDKTLGWIIFLFRINVVVVVHIMYYVISWFYLKMLYAELFQLFLPHYQWKLLCKT